MEQNFSLKDILFFKQREEDHVSHILGKIWHVWICQIKINVQSMEKNMFQKW